MQGVTGLAHVPGRARYPRLKPQRHQAVVGRVELHLVDPPAETVIGKERRGHTIGLNRHGLGFGRPDRSPKAARRSAWIPAPDQAQADLRISSPVDRFTSSGGRAWLVTLWMASRVRGLR